MSICSWFCFFVCFDLAFISEISEIIISCILKYSLSFVSFLGDNIFHFGIMIFIWHFCHGIIFCEVIFLCFLLFYKLMWIMSMTLFCSFLLEIRLFVVRFWHLEMTYYSCDFLTQTSMEENVSTAGKILHLVIMECMDWLSRTALEP